MSTFCAYLTVYYGKLLSIFYIGSTSISKISKESVSSKEYSKLWIGNTYLKIKLYGLWPICGELLNK